MCAPHAFCAFSMLCALRAFCTFHAFCAFSAVCCTHCTHFACGAFCVLCVRVVRAVCMVRAVRTFLWASRGTCDTRVLCVSWVQKPLRHPHVYNTLHPTILVMHFLVRAIRAFERFVHFARFARWVCFARFAPFDNMDFHGGGGINDRDPPSFRARGTVFEFRGARGGEPPPPIALAAPPIACHFRGPGVP